MESNKVLRLRPWTLLVALAAMLLGLPIASRAQSSDDFPNQTIRIIVGYAPGGGTDLSARVIARKLSELLKVSVVVENRPGAATLIAVNTLKASKPDGYTLLLGTGAPIQMAALDKLQLDTIRDFTHVAMLGTAKSILSVSPKQGVKSVAQLIEQAKKNPGGLSYATAGAGSATHLPIAVLEHELGVRFNPIPYKGDAPAATAIASGEVAFGINGVPTALPFIQSGRMLPLAVSGSERLRELPNVPTYAEAGLPKAAVLHPFTFYFVAAPAGTSTARAAILGQAIGKALADPEVVESFAKLGVDVQPMDTAGITAFIKAETEKWRQYAGKLSLE